MSFRLDMSFHLAAALALCISSVASANAQDAVESKVQICASCHGKAGASDDPTIPILWGQQAAYLEKQLRDYKSGTRDSQIMSSIIESLKDDELSQVAAFFAGKTWPAAKDAAQAAPGKPPAAALACVACHGDTFRGGPVPDGTTAPRLAGQFSDYLSATMEAFATGERANNETMTALLKSQSSADREAIAHYLSGL
jgi:cytochrome c553